MSSSAPVAVPDAVSPPPHNPRFPLVDGVRAIAALSILVTHTAGLSGFNSSDALGAWTARLDVGVAIFFVLSGFLLYRPWVAARLDGRPAPRVRAYARRRALRILPAYWVALATLGLLLPERVVGAFGGDWWIYFGLLQSWSIDTVIGGIPVAWSLSVEAAFYVLLPLLAIAAGRLLAGRARDAQVRIELWVLAASAVAALVLRTVVRTGDPEGVFGNTLPGMWGWFAGGMALAVLSAAHAGRPVAERPALLRSAAQRPWLWWFGALVALTVAAKGVSLPRSFFDPYTAFNTQASHVLYAAVAVLLVAPAAFSDGRRTGVSRILASRPLAWLGLVSYGIFLYHLPLVFELQESVGWLPAGGFFFYTVLAAAAAITCAAASYYLVEKPLLTFKDPPRGGRRAARPVPAPAAAR